MAETPWIIVAAAIGPPLAYAALLALLDRRRPRPWTVIAGALAWGFAAAMASAPLNDLVMDRLASTTSATRAHELAATAGAPVIEEALKGLGPLLLVLVRPQLLRSVRDGIVCGGLVGLGFDLAENLQYLTLAIVQGGMGGLARGTWVRGILGGVKHAVFTATVGAGLGWARGSSNRRARLVVPLLAFSAAVAQHAVWNAVASAAITRALCGAATAEAACRATPAGVALFVSVPLIVALCVGPGILLLAAFDRRSARRQSSVLLVTLALGGTLAPTPASADGGTVRLMESTGPFIVTVFSAPEPLRVGPVDVSVLVQDRSGGAPLLDALVSLDAAPPGGADVAPVRRDATRAEAVNKLVYAAALTIDVPGAWTLGVTVRRGDDVATVRCPLPVLPAASGLRHLWPYLALPPAVVTLYILHGWLARRRRVLAPAAPSRRRHASR